MPAYVISDVAARDRAAFETYRSRAAESIARHGRRYIVRGGETETLEGDWRPRTIVIVEFRDLERARSWYRSRDYAVALDVRDQALERNLILVDGVPVSPES